MAYGRKKKQIDSPGGILPNNVIFEEVEYKNTYQYAIKTADEVNVVPFVELNEIVYYPMVPPPWTVPPPPIEYGSSEDLWKDTYQFIYEHLDIMDESLYDINVGWVEHTWVTERYDSVPYLHFWGEKNTGKTRALDVLSLLCYRPMLSPSVSGAAVYYAIDYYHPTFLLDEFEMYQQLKDAKAEVIGILNAGYRRGQGVYRVGSVSEGNPTLRRFSVFGPKALSSIMELPSALDSRCIKIRMARAYRKIKRMMDKEWARELRGKLLQYRFNHLFDPIPESENPLDLPDGRLIELYYPIEQLAPNEAIKKTILACARKQYNIGIESMRETFSATIYHEIIDYIEEYLSNIGKPPLTLSQQMLRERLNKDVPEGRKGVSRQKLSVLLRKLMFNNVENKQTRLKEIALDPAVLERQKTSYALIHEMERVDRLLGELRIIWKDPSTLATLDTLGTLDLFALSRGGDQENDKKKKEEYKNLNGLINLKASNEPSKANVSNVSNVPNALVNASLKEKTEWIFDYVSKFEGGITAGELAEKSGMPLNEMERLLTHMAKSDDIFQPRPGVWKTV